MSDLKKNSLAKSLRELEARRPGNFIILSAVSRISEDRLKQLSRGVGEKMTDGEEMILERLSKLGV